MEKPDHYERLARVELFRRRWSLRRIPDLAVHRRIKVPPAWAEANPREPQSSYLYDLVADAAELSSGMTFLDAGCGFGSQVVRLESTRNAHGVGISTSPTQVNRANRLIRQRGCGGKCAVRLGSFDEPLSGHFDAVTAVESLIHAKDIARTISSLASVLREGGVMVIIDDLWQTTPSSLPEFVVKGWSIHSPLTASILQDALVNGGICVSKTWDMTGSVKTINPVLQSQLARMLSAISRIKPFSQRPLVDFYRAQIFRQGAMLAGDLRYTMLVGYKQSESA
jgi:SAM-dependent methyltransferase